MKIHEKKKPSETDEKSTPSVSTMKLSVLKTMLKALQPCAGKLEFNKVDFYADPATWTLTLSTSNGVRAAQATASVRGIDRQRKLCLCFSALSGFVGIEDSEKESFDNKDNDTLLEATDGKLTIRGQGAAAVRSLPLYSTEQGLLLPEFDRDKKGVTFTFGSAPAFAEILASAASAASPDDSRLSLNGVCLRWTAGDRTLKLCASSGCVLAEIVAEILADDSSVPATDDDVLISLESVSALQKALKTADPNSRLTLIFCADTARQRTAFFKFSAKSEVGITLALPTVAAKFPSTERLFAEFSATPDTAVLRVDSAVFAGIIAQLLKTTADYPGSRRVRLGFSDSPGHGGAQSIFVTSASSGYEASLPATNTLGVPLPAHAQDSFFDAGLLYSALVAFGGAPVYLCFAASAEHRVLITKTNNPAESAHRRILAGVR